MFSIRAASRRRRGGFPFMPGPARCRYRYPIATESVPQSQICPFRQPRCFPQQLSSGSNPLLQTVFPEARLPSFFEGVGAPFPELSTQGRLRCTQRSRRKSRVAPQCRFKPVPYNGRLDHKGSTPLHEIRSPQRAGRSFHAIETRPTAAGKVASPQHPPQTGRKKQTPEAS